MRHLQLVLYLSTQGSLRRAADAMAITQPGATKALKELEEIIGVPLFARTARGMEPTPFGDEVISYAETMLARLDDMHHSLTAIKSGETGRVRVGSVMSHSTEFLAVTVMKLKRTHSNIQLSVHIGSNDELQQSLHQEQLDLIVGNVGDSLSQDFIFEVLSDVTLSLVARHSHPVHLETSVGNWNALSAYRWVLQPQPSPLRSAVERFFHVMNLHTPSDKIETESILATLPLVTEAGMVAMLPTPVARYYERLNILRAVDLPFLFDLTRCGLILRRNCRPTPTAKIVIECIRNTAREHFMEEGESQAIHPDDFHPEVAALIGEAALDR